MASDDSFRVEDFINAITSQLDRVQDSLRLKAVNRPLTYALKDLALELQVFVELDAEGNVRFRTSGPNETGASTVRLGFTTITKPMIEENTVSLAMTRSPLLNELGLDPEEQKRLEQLGVRNAAQLQRLGTSTGANTVARLANIPVERLRQALSATRPRVNAVRPAPPRPPVAPQPLPQPAPPPRPAVTPRPPVAPRPPVYTQPPVAPGRPVVSTPPPFRPAPAAGAPAVPPVVVQPPPPVFNAPPPRVVAAPPPAAGAPVFGPPPPRARRPGTPENPIRVSDRTGGLSYEQSATPEPTVAIAPGTRRLHLYGQNLIGEGGAPEVRLNGEALGVSEADDDRLVVDVPEGAQGGALEVLLHDGQTLSFSLSVTPDAPAADEEEAYAASADAYDYGYGFGGNGDGAADAHPYANQRDWWEPGGGE